MIKRIHLVSARHSSHKWGIGNYLMSNSIYKALANLGYEIIDTDYRQQKFSPMFDLSQPADMLLILKGEGISPESIKKAPGIKVLWYRDLLSDDPNDGLGGTRERELSYNVHAYDMCFFHLPLLDKIKEMGCKKVFLFPDASADKDIFRRLNVEKEYDIVFVGSKSEHRQEIYNLIKSKKPELKIFWADNIIDYNEYNKILNQGKICLNIHYTKSLNIETRIYEVMASGSFLLTEPLFDYWPHEVSFEIFKNKDELLEKIDFYLINSEYRESMAMLGCTIMHNYSSWENVVKKLIKIVEENNE